MYLAAYGKMSSIEEDADLDSAQACVYLAEHLVCYEMGALASARESECLLPAHGR